MKLNAILAVAALAGATALSAQTVQKLDDEKYVLSVQDLSMTVSMAEASGAGIVMVRKPSLSAFHLRGAPSGKLFTAVGFPWKGMTRMPLSPETGTAAGSRMWRKTVPGRFVLTPQLWGGTGETPQPSTVEA